MSYENPIPLFSDAELAKLISATTDAMKGLQQRELTSDLLYELRQKTNCRTFGELLDVLEDEARYRKDLAQTFAPRNRFDNVTDLLLAVSIVLALATMYYLYLA